MVKVNFEPLFKKIFCKIKSKEIKEKIIKQFEKIKSNPEIGKPMMHSRKGTREVYIKQFRLSYLHIKKEDKIIFLDLYHKDEQ